MELMLDVDREVVVNLKHGQKAFDKVLRRVMDLWPLKSKPRDFLAFTPSTGTLVTGGKLRIYREDGAELLLGHVTMLEEPHGIAVRGQMGLSGFVLSEWTLTFRDAGASTLVRLTHRVVGEVTDEEVARYTAGWAAAVDALGEEFSGSRDT